MVKISEISFDNFLARVITELKPTSKNLNSIVKTIYDKRGNYQVVNGIRMVQSAIAKDNKLENATIKTGVLIGCNDKKGSKAPIKAALLLQNQSHIELLLWDVKVPYGDGLDSPLIFPSVMKIAMSPSERGGMILERVLEYKKLNSASEVIEKLEKLKAITTVKGARNPNKETFNFPVAVLKGTIQSAGPITSSAYGEEEKTHFSVWEENEKKVSEGNPSLNLKLKTEDEETIWVKINPRRYSKGYYDISDLNTACQDAIKETDDPKSQAEFVSGVIYGKKVIVVGSVTGKDENPQYGLSISMNSHAIIEIPTGEEEPKESEFEPQQKLPETKNDDIKPEGIPVSSTNDIGETNGTGSIGGESETNNNQETETGPGDQNTDELQNEVQPESTTEDTSPLMEEIKKKLLWQAGILSKKRSIEEKKTYLKGMKFKEDIIDKLKFDDWAIVKATELNIDITKEIATAIVQQTYEELTR